MSGGDSAAEIIAARLAEAGCRQVFGMPGGEVLVLLEALRAAGVEFTLCKHENAAGFMAEGSWHATGAPGVLLTTIGPGLANAVNSIANAFQEQVPLSVLSGCIGDAQAARFTHQVIDQRALLAPVTKASLRVAPGGAAAVIDKALAIALADPPGPVHVDLPVDVAALTETGGDSGEAGQGSRPGPHAPATACPPGGPGLAAALDRLKRAERPVLLAGLGAVHHRAGPPITRLCERHDIPMLTTYKAKGLLDESHPLCLGGHGLSPLSDSHVLPLLRQSDCVILAGYDPIEMRAGWIDPWAGENALEFLPAAVEHGMHGRALRLICDIAGAMEALDRGLGETRFTPWAQGAPAAVRAALAAAFAGPERWGPHQLFAALNQALPAGGICTVDSGAHRILLSQIWRASRPGELLQSSCFCTMGVAVPLAIGHLKAAPDRPVIAVVGDAGFDMSPGDLATLRDLNRPMVIVVPVDGSLALIERKQAGMQIMKHGVSFPDSDIGAIARAYGGNSAIVTSRKSLFTETNEAWARSRFTVLTCPIDKGDYDGAF